MSAFDYNTLEDKHLMFNTRERRQLLPKPNSSPSLNTVQTINTVWDNNQRLLYIILSLAILLISAISIKAQNIMGERRVYYLDATYSMITPSKLWNPVRNDLAKAINAIEDETTEIYVIAFGGNGGTELQSWNGYATAEGKAKIITGFQNFTPLKNTMTYLDKPINDFYHNRVASDKVTYCFLMTDGRDENKNVSVFPNALREWGSKYGNSNVYGFYVMLNNNARDKDIEHIIDSQEHLWKVETADININLIRLDKRVVFNVRNDDSIVIPITGKCNGLNFNVSLPEASGLKVKSCKVKDGKLIVKTDVIGNKSTMPESSTYNLSVSVSNADKFDFLVTDKVSIKCYNKKELVLLSPTGNQKMGKVSHYDDFLFVPGKTVPVHHTIEFSFNQDAKDNKKTFAEFAFVNNNGLPVSPKDMTISVNGKKLDNNRFRVTPVQDKVNVEISFPSGAKKGKHQGYLRLVNHNLHRLNSNECSGQTSDAFQWTVYNRQLMNPLEKVLMWIGIILAAILILWFTVIKPIRFPCFPKFRKMVLVKKDGIVAAQFSCNFKGARQVVFAAKRQHQSALNRLFCGRIDTIVNQVFEEPITFIPKKKKKAMVKGKGYFVNPNPISQSGVAEISTPDKKLIISLQ